MGRVLTASRCRVPAEHEREYLKTLLGLARIGMQRGQRIWLFRLAADPHRFIEFTEAPTRLAHRQFASKTTPEQQLERRLARLAVYDEDAWEMYEEHPLAGTTARDYGETDD